MPLRVVLNVAYAMLVDGLDRKQRDEFDTKLYGWGAMNDRANQRLRAPYAGDDDSGGEG